MGAVRRISTPPSRLVHQRPVTCLWMPGVFHQRPRQEEVTQVLKRVLFAGAIVGVMALMGYGVYEAVAGEGVESHASVEAGRGAEGVWTEAADGFTQRGPGQGQGVGRSAGNPGSSVGQPGGWGRPSEQTPAQPYPEADPTWTELSGTVVLLDGSELVLQTAQGGQLTAGLGKPSYWESQGLGLQPGDEVQIRGFWEDGEFEVGSLTLVATGKTVVMRDETGRPQWAGGGRWASPAGASSGQSF